jgi:hypothetical protein
LYRSGCAPAGHRSLPSGNCEEITPVSNACRVKAAFSLRLALVRPQLSVEELIPMAIDIEHLKHFQTEQLEQKNIQTSARIPIHTRTTEWALIEIVILLTGISESLKRMADRP